MPISETQADILGRLLVIQQMLEVLPSPQEISAFLDRALRQVPGVEAAHLYVERRLLPPDPVIERFYGSGVGGTEPIPDWIASFPIHTLRRVYGFLALRVADREGFAPYRDFMANIANSVANHLETQDHLRQITAANSELQRQVEARTQELSRQNASLQAEMGKSRAALAALAESESRFRQLAENIDEVFWLAEWPQNRVIYVSPAFERIWELPVERLYQDSALWLDAIVEEDRETVERALSAGIDQTDLDIVYRLRGTGGRVRWIHDRSFAIRDAGGKVFRIAGVARDISADKAAEEQLSKLSLALEQSAESIVITDLDANIEYVNAAFVQNTGYTLDEVKGRNPRILQSGKTPPETYRALWAALVQGRGWKGELVNRRKNGEEHVEFAAISPIRRADGRITHYVAVKEDITERIALAGELERHRLHLEELVRERTLELAEAQAKAERANQAKSSFLANMSHEIRTPMNAIMGMTELCLAADPDARQRGYLAKIRGASQALLHVIDDILDFSKIEAGKLDMVVEPFCLAEVFDRLASLLTGKAHEKGLELEFRIAPGLEGCLRGDAQRLGQVLINLTGNAIKFSHAGRVRVSVEEASRQEGASTLRFEVRDQGIGISAEERARLFQPFTQADASTTRSYGGTGLGLAISKRLAELMDGRIWVDSVPGQGSSFQFEARFALGDRFPPPCRKSRPGADGAVLKRLRGADILVVEDAELNQEMMRELLERAGFRVRLAVNGEEALRAVERSPPDCVLMDCQMPVMDGFEATRRLRAEERYRELPIIALTANAMAGDRERCLAAGMNGFVAKPVDFGELYAALARWVRPGWGAVAVPTGSSAAASPPEPSALPELPGIDTARGLALTGGQVSFYLKLLKTFRDGQASGFPRLFREAQAAGDRATAARLAHTLKGTARTLGAGPLGNLAGHLEETALEGRPEAVAERLETLAGELARVRAGLDRLDPPEPEVPAPVAASGELEILVRDLDRLLEESDTAAIDRVATLERAMAGGERQAEAMAIGLAIARYDFAEARARLRRLTSTPDRPGGGDP